MLRNAPARKGWCPGALAPMAARDGLIARARPRAGRLSADDARALAQAARDLGNGVCEITSRANLQLRGLREETLPAFRAVLAALRLLDESVGAEATRNILVSPLAGLGGAPDVGALAQALAAALAQAQDLHALPAKFGYALDDGGPLTLAHEGADLRFTFEAGRGLFSIAAGGAGPQAVGLGFCARDEIIPLALSLGRAFLAICGRLPEPPRRLGGLLARLGAENFARETGRPSTAPPTAPTAPRPPVGFATYDGLACLGAGAPFGRLSAAMLEALAEAARTASGDIRLTPWRVFLLPGADAGAAARLERAGFILSGDDARLAVAACGGAPSCAQGSSPAQDDALALAPLARALTPDGLVLHVAGCAKGCAHPRPAPLTLVARTGRYDLVRDGTARDRPSVENLSLTQARDLLHAMTGRGAARTWGEMTAPDAARFDYLKDGAEIYRRSFATIRAEADLSRFSPDEEVAAVRMIHACGMVEIAADLVFSPGAAASARAALAAGAAILCDSRMVADGITRARLPAGNEIVCSLDDPALPALAREKGDTRSAAAVELWGERVAGAVVAVGNAPTALFALLNLMARTQLRPACVIGVPVGFVGAAESKEALIESAPAPFIALRGRRGGSAIAAAAVNALAGAPE